MQLEADIIRVLQTAVGPVILISGMGFLLLTMINRLSRIIDRARELFQAAEGDHAARDRQVDILWHRARRMQFAILSALCSIFSSALLVISLFIATLSTVDLGWLVISLFISSMIFLIFALILFIRDVNESLTALEIELGRGKGRISKEGPGSGRT